VSYRVTSDLITPLIKLTHRTTFTSPRDPNIDSKESKRIELILIDWDGRAGEDSLRVFGGVDREDRIALSLRPRVPHNNLGTRVPFTNGRHAANVQIDGVPSAFPLIDPA